MFEEFIDLLGVTTAVFIVSFSLLCCSYLSKYIYLHPGVILRRSKIQGGVNNNGFRHSNTDQDNHVVSSLKSNKRNDLNIEIQNIHKQNSDASLSVTPRLSTTSNSDIDNEYNDLSTPATSIDSTNSPELNTNSLSNGVGAFHSEDEVAMREILVAPEFPYLTMTNEVAQSRPKFIFPNARKIQVIESEFISAKVLVALRVKDNSGRDYSLQEKNYKEIQEHFFEGKKRMLEFQIQMRFKRKPRGELYFGGEIPRTMKLGLMSRSFATVVLTLLNRLSKGSHASFGDKVNEQMPITELEDKEMPHIVVPLRVAANYININRANEHKDSMPSLEANTFPEETTEMKKHRKQNPLNLEEGDILTFTFNSMYLDLIRWKAVHIGALNDMSLSSFWDTMPLCFVLYDLPIPQLKEHGEKIKHLNKLKRYYINIKITNTLYSVDPKDLSPSNSNGKMVVYKPITPPSFETMMEEAHKMEDSLAEISIQPQIAELSQPGAGDVEKSSESFLRMTRVVSVVERISYDRSGKKSFIYKLAILAKEELKNAYSLYFQDLSSFKSIELPSLIRDIYSTYENVFGLRDIVSSSIRAYKLESLREKMDFCLANIKLAADRSGSNKDSIPRSWGQKAKISHSESTLDASDLIQIRHELSKLLGLSGENKLLTIELHANVLLARSETTWAENLIVVATVASEFDRLILLYQPHTLIPWKAMLASELTHSRLLSVQNDDFSTECPSFALCVPTIELATMNRIWHFGFESISSAQKAQKLIGAPLGTVNADIRDSPSTPEILFSVSNPRSNLNKTLPKMVSLTPLKRSSSDGSRFSLFKTTSTAKILKTSRSSLPASDSSHTIYCDNKMPAGLPEMIINLRSGLKDCLSSDFYDVDETYSKLGRKVINIRGLNHHCCITNDYFINDDFMFNKFVEFVQNTSNGCRLKSERTRNLDGHRLERIRFENSFFSKYNAEFYQFRTLLVDPVALSVEVLSTAIKLHSVLQRQSASDLSTLLWSLHLKLNQAAGKLCHVNLTGLEESDEEDRAGFFLNIYNALRLHAAIIFGQAKGFFDWYSFGLTSYKIGGSVFSLLDLEHQVLKKAFTPITVGPKYLSLTLKFRYNSTLWCTALAPRRLRLPLVFCLNCGTGSCISDIPVFYLKPSLNNELIEYTKLFMSHQIDIDDNAGHIYLPKVAYWHRKDLVTAIDNDLELSQLLQAYGTIIEHQASVWKRSSVMVQRYANVPSAIKLTIALVPYMYPDQQQKVVALLLNENKQVKVKIKKYEWAPFYG